METIQSTSSGCLKEPKSEPQSLALQEWHTVSLKVSVQIKRREFFIFRVKLIMSYCSCQLCCSQCLLARALIEFTTRFCAAGVVKRIIPAVASTNAVIAGEEKEARSFKWLPLTVQFTNLLLSLPLQLPAPLKFSKLLQGQEQKINMSADLSNEYY